MTHRAAAAGGGERSRRNAVPAGKHGPELRCPHRRCRAQQRPACASSPFTFADVFRFLWKRLVSPWSCLVLSPLRHAGAAEISHPSACFLSRCCEPWWGAGGGRAPANPLPARTPAGPGLASALVSMTGLGRNTALRTNQS